MADEGYLNQVAQLFEWAASNALATAPTDALKAYMKRRTDAARQILLEEISRGERQMLAVAMDDDRIWFHWRFGRAAIDGAAHENLRLLARLISGLPVEPDLLLSRFHLYANLIAAMTRDELRVLAAFVRFEKEIHARPGGNVWRLRDVEKILVPSQIASESYFNVLVHSLVGKGLLIPPERGMDGLGDFMPSELASELEALAKLSEFV